MELKDAPVSPVPDKEPAVLPPARAPSRKPKAREASLEFEETSDIHGLVTRDPSFSFFEGGEAL